MVWHHDETSGATVDLRYCATLLVAVFPPPVFCVVLTKACGSPLSKAGAGRLDVGCMDASCTSMRSS